MNPKLTLVLGILCISFSPIFVKLAVAPPITTAFYRIFIGWVCLAPYCVAKAKYKIERKALFIAIAGGIVFGVDIAVWNMSLVKITATVSTLLANLAPVWVGLMSFIFFRKRAGKLFWIGTFVAMFGMVVLVGYQDIITLKFNIGIPLALLASFLYAVYLVISKGILQKISTLTFMFYNMLAASIFLFIVCLFQRYDMIHFSNATWVVFIAMGLLCQVAGWLLLNHSITFLDPTKVSIALLAQTVIACFLASFMLNEKLALKEIIGSVIVLAGIAFTFLKYGKANKIVN